MSRGRRERLLQALLGRPSPARWTLPLFTGLGCGLVLGAALALLYAPSTGTELRQGLAEGLGRMKARFHVDKATNGHRPGRPTDDLGEG